MIYFRGIFIIWNDCHNKQIVYSRRFASVENRAKKIQNEQYVSLPKNDELLQHIIVNLRFSSEPLKFVETRDSCERLNTTPVHSIPIQKSKAVNLVVIPEKNWLFCCVPLIDHCVDDSQMINCSTEIPVALSMLEGLIQLLSPLPEANVLEYSKTASLDMYVSQVMPFGRPIDVDPVVYQGKLQNKSITTSSTSKQPAWKPLPHKGHASVSLTITEFVKCAQYGKPDALDVISINGCITCLALLEGSSPEVSLAITHHDPKKKLDISTLLVHPCVSAVDPANHITAPSWPLYKLRFMPPVNTFSLCNYMVPNVKDVPVYGSFKLRENSGMDLLLQLKLNEDLKNSFKYFEVKIPFFDREIRSANIKPSWGMANISPERSTIIWNLGNRFPSKTLETSLKAAILFFDQQDQSTRETMLNFYAQVHFSTKSNLPSESHIDGKAIHVSPAVKVKFNLEKEYVTADYKIWNSQMLVPAPVPFC